MSPRPDKGEARPRERRLVPDLSDTIEAGGQTLTRARRVPIEDSDPEPALEPEPVEQKTLDSIAKKHLGAIVSELVETLTDEEPPPEPVPKSHAPRTELFGDEAPPPDPETNPKKRAEGAVSPIVLTDDAPVDLLPYSKPETLIDLFNLFPKINGRDWFIHVKRKAPTQAYGMKITGPQRAINRPLSYSEWEAIYGGGTFELIVYGPPKTGNVLDYQGRIQPRRLTDPFLFDFPGPPNTEGLVHAGGEEDPMNPSLVEGQLPRRPQTIAEGKVEEARIEVAAQRELRGESREEKERAKAERLQQEQLNASSAMMKTFMEMQDKAAAREAQLRSDQIEREREIAREHAIELRELAASMEEKIKSLVDQKKPDDTERIINLTNALGKNNTSADDLRAQHTAELQRLAESRTREQDNFNLQLKDARERSDRLVSDERQRADQRIKDAEERFHNKERDERERASSEIQKIKDECERRLQDQHRQMESRLADQDRNHQRDTASKDAAHAMQLQTTISTWEMRLDQAKGETKRAGADIERYRKEADENKDVVGKITKLKEDAAALGMIDASEAGSNEPETFAQMAMKVGTNLAGALPSIVENVGNMLKGKDEQALQQARLQGRQEMMAQAGQLQHSPPGLPPAHSRRGVPRLAPFQPISQATSAPLIPGHEPGRHNPSSQQIRPIPTAADLQPEEIMRQEALLRQQQLEQQALFAQPPAIPGPNVDPFHTGMPPEPQMVAPQTMPPPAPSIPPPAFQSAPPPAASDPALLAQRAEDQQIVSSLEGFVLPSYENQVPAELLAAEFANRFPKAQIQQILTELGSPERLIAAFEREKGSSHPFARRDGKKYLRGLFAGLAKASA